MKNLRELLGTLARHRVEFIVVGGVAATMHGSARVTQDLDIVYARNEANLGRLADALRDGRPYPRGAPDGLPFRWDVSTLLGGLNFTLKTDLGNLDLLGEIPGGGTYEDLLSRSPLLEVYGLRCRCLDLETLIQVKLAAGRPRDLEAIAELYVIHEESERMERRKEKEGERRRTKTRRGEKERNERKSDGARKR
jgi:predicted nucleotidyltransferase